MAPLGFEPGGSDSGRVKIPSHFMSDRWFLVGYVGGELVRKAAGWFSSDILRKSKQHHYLKVQRCRQIRKKNMAQTDCQGKNRRKVRISFSQFVFDAIGKVVLFVVSCFTNSNVYLRDGSAQTKIIMHTATLR